MKERFRVFMYGRYGQDNLNRFLNVMSLLIMIVSLFTKIVFLNLFALALLFVPILRMFSKNTGKRSQENYAYLRLKGKITRRYFTQKKKFNTWKTLRKRKHDERKTHCYYKCPSCRLQLRVPKGRGKITITCPKCRTSFKKKT